MKGVCGPCYGSGALLPVHHRGVPLVISGIFRQFSTGTELSLFPCQYCYLNPPCAYFFHQSPTLPNPSNWDFC